MNYIERLPAPFTAGQDRIDREAEGNKRREEKSADRENALLYRLSLTLSGKKAGDR